MAAATLPAGLVLQPGARTLRAFCTSVTPAARSAIPSPRECQSRRLRALREVRGRDTESMMAAAVAESSRSWGDSAGLSLALPVGKPK